MGICLGYVTASDETIHRILADPPLAGYLLDPTGENELVAEFARQHGRGLLSRLFGRKQRDRAPDSLPLREGEGEEGDLDKVFGAVLFLLGEKLDDKVFDGEPVGKLVYGVGGIHAVRSDRVRRVATTAASLSREEARARFDPKTMSETGIHELMGDEDEDFDSAWDKLCELREAWGRAAERNLGMLVVFD